MPKNSQEYTQLVRQLVDQYAEKVFATASENQAWIDATGDGTSRIYFDVELSILKWLNDTGIKNKDLVTALVNRHKEIFIAEVRKRFADSRFTKYSDFKTVRPALVAPVSQAELADMEAAFVSANEIFFNDPVIRQITHGLKIDRAWFQMGVGQTSDQAALAARFARTDGGQHNVRYFWDPYVKQKLSKKFLAVREMEKRIGPLSLEMFADARKGGSNVPEAILRYVQAVDEFSPNMLISERETLTIHRAPYGVFSIDFIGLGAENLLATAKALSAATSLDDALIRARAAEQAVTRSFRDRKALVDNVVQEFFKNSATVRFSGDDGVIIPDIETLLREQMFLVQKLASLFPRPSFRVSVIGREGAASDNSSELITHAESIEKKMRGMLVLENGNDIAKDIHMGVVIHDSGPARKVYLLLGISRPLTEGEKAKIVQLFPRAVQAVQREVQAGGRNVSYEAIDVFALKGGRRSRLAGTGI